MPLDSMDEASLRQAIAPIAQHRLKLVACGVGASRDDFRPDLFHLCREDRDILATGQTHDSKKLLEARDHR